MAELGETDRAALVLRFFENKTVGEIAGALRMEEAAAQKRVGRALEKLRVHFSKHGIALPAAALTAAISANAVQAAPVGLAVTISTAAALAGTTFATTAINTTAKAIAMTTLQKTIVTTTVAVLAGAGIYEARQASQLRNQVQMLQEQQAPLTEQIAQLQHELDDATNRLAGSTEELANAKRNNLDLLKLRGEVGLLRRQTNQLGGLLKEAARKPPEPATEASENELVTRAQYKFAGFAEPKSTVNSTYWAINQGDIQTVLASMSPALQSKTREEWKDIPDDKLKAGLLNDSDNRNVTGYRITNKLVVSGDEVVLTIFQEGRNREKKMRFVRVGAEWKYDGPPKM